MLWVYFKKGGNHYKMVITRVDYWTKKRYQDSLILLGHFHGYLIYNWVWFGDARYLSALWLLCTSSWPINFLRRSPNSIQYVALYRIEILFIFSILFYGSPKNSPDYRTHFNFSLNFYTNLLDKALTI